MNNEEKGEFMENIGCPMSTMMDCLNMVEWADKVVTF